MKVVLLETESLGMLSSFSVSDELIYRTNICNSFLCYYNLTYLMTICSLGSDRFMACCVFMSQFFLSYYHSVLYKNIYCLESGFLINRLTVVNLGKKLCSFI